MTSHRVLHLGKYLPPEPGGIERFTLDLLTAQSRRGDKPALLGHRPSRQTSSPKLPFPTYGARTIGRLVHAPVAPGLPRAFEAAIRTHSPDLLHIHMPNASAAYALLSSRAKGIPWVIHWHADVVASTIDSRIAIAYRAYRPLERRVLGRAHSVIATSEAYAAQSEALQRWRAKVVVVPLGLDPTPVRRYSQAAELEARELWPGDGLKLLFVGRFSYYKGVHVLLDALRAVAGVQAVLAGDGPRLQVARRDAQSMPQVSLPGEVSDDVRNALLHSADVLVLPSVEKTEAFGLVLLEAMVAGLQVIATEVPGSGMPEVVARGKHGVVVPPDDVAALREALIAVRDASADQTALRQSIAARFDQCFHIDRVAGEIAEVYDGARRR